MTSAGHSEMHPAIEGAVRGQSSISMNNGAMSCDTSRIKWMYQKTYCDSSLIRRTEWKAQQVMAPGVILEEDGRGYLLIEMKITTNFGK